MADPATTVQVNGGIDGTVKVGENTGESVKVNGNSGGIVNESFENGPGDPPPYNGHGISNKDAEASESANKEKTDGEEEGDGRATWSNGLEFLMSCIATSVGLGNIWRFPFTAYKNGGGAFLIPYIIVLFLVGKPMYYMEMVLGQFSSRNSVKVWSVMPPFKGVGWGQTLGTASILSYYVSIMALTLYYLAMSFNSQLPWSYCREEWGPDCFSSSESGEPGENATSSSELYFVKEVLKETPTIHDGIGLPEWRLTLCLFASWVAIFLTMIKGVKSSGKAAYFLALFPYVIMFVLLIRAVTLPGAGNGVLFFITPKWSELYNPAVWYAAVTQVFFSLSVCTGSIIMYSSYNGFSHNVYRDALIVTTLDTFTSLLSGFTIFAILGNLAHELNIDDIDEVVGGGGTGIAFISYPDAIAKFDSVPQLFAVMFFFMLFVLGLGSAVALHSCVTTVFADYFPSLGYTTIAGIGSLGGFLIGLVYVTPGGQYILNLVDHYGGTFLILAMGIGEIIGIFWLYGLENFCEDLEFMLKIKVGLFWRWCWGIITPALMIAVFIYALVTIEALKYGEYIYPDSAYAAGAVLLAVGVVQIPIWAVIYLAKNRQRSFKETIVQGFKSNSQWGPKYKNNRTSWREFKLAAKQNRKAMNQNSRWKHYWYSLCGTYRKKTD